MRIGTATIKSLFKLMITITAGLLIALFFAVVASGSFFRAIRGFGEQPLELVIFNWLLVALTVPIAIAGLIIALKGLSLLLTCLIRRRFGPLDMPPIPDVRPDEPPGGAPVFARLGPKNPAPLAAHALPYSNG